MNGREESLDWAERWLRSALDIVSPPGFFQSLEVDMSACKERIEALRAEGTKVTYTHVFVRATALALESDPELHQLVIGNRRWLPDRVDIGLSVAGETFVAPVLVIDDASNKSTSEIASEVANRTPQVLAEEKEFLQANRRWGWLAPFGFLRRTILKRIVSRFSFVRETNGTFQLSCVNDVDQSVPLLFSTSAILGTGQVKERPMVIDGNLCVRPTVILSCCADHRVWDGVKGVRFLNRIKKILEAAEF